MELGGIVITGASSGIGRALAEALAGPGRRMLLIARGEADLEAVARRLRAAGTEAQTAALSVTEAAALADRIAAFDAAAPVGLAIANAGVSAGQAPDGDWEGAEAARRAIAVNLTGAINTVEPLLGPMRARGLGRICLVSSLAALRPLPQMPGYGASKAGLRAYGVALRGLARPAGITVTVACPGFVTTPMSARHLGPRPFELAPERAARLILAATLRGRAFATFPWQLALLSRLSAALPPALSDRLVRSFAARIAPDTRER